MKNIIATVIAALMAGALAGYIAAPKSMEQASQQTVAKESSFDRVMRTKTLRCGYVVYPPTVIKDDNSGAMSGIMHDIIESAAAKIDLKVEWAEELNWGNYMTALAYDHADMICAAAWNNNAAEWREAEAIGPLFYSGIGVWVRRDDNRFAGNFAAINDPGVTISSIDGTIPGRIAAVDFPQAKLLSLPQASDYTLNLLNVKDGKADVTFVENYQGLSFLESNPGSIKNIAAASPVRTFPNVFLVRKGETGLKDTFSSIIQDMANNGEIEAIIRKYEKYPGAFYRIAKPYQP
ncbi:MAG: transporter substrate-binding domain-containing protein [Alphaproteobacteria bacterium]